MVIDWRNLVGQCETHSVACAIPAPDSLAEVLAGFGLELAAVSVGIAFAPGTSGPLLAMHEENDKLADVARSYSWEVMEGLLRTEDGQVREKMTDTHCALKLAELAYERPAGIEAAVMLTRDHDLVPAAAFANSRGLPTYLASADPADTRPAPRFHLTVPTLRRVCGQAPTIDVDSLIARTEFLWDPGPHTWTVVGEGNLHRSSGWFLEHADGWRGFAASSEVGQVVAGQELVLISADVGFDGSVPVAWCWPTADTPGFDYIRDVKILRREDSKKVLAEVDEVDMRFTCQLGVAEKGQRVLVRLRRSGDPLKQDGAARLIGPLAKPSGSHLHDGRVASRWPTPLRVLKAQRGSVAEVVDGEGIPARLAASQIAKTFEAGGWYSGVLRPPDAHRSTRAPLFDAVSTRLMHLD